MPVRPEVPVLETNRLRLRQHRLEDFDVCAALWNDAQVIRYIGGNASSREEVWARLLRYVGHWALLGYGFWAVEEKESGEFVGELGFFDGRREMEPAIAGTPEVGWAFSSRVHGKGYATEALRAVLAWGDIRFGDSPTVCIIEPENVASIRLAEKFGYRELRRTVYKGSAMVMFER